MSSTQHYRMFLMRIQPEGRPLLDLTADEQRRSRTSILEELIVEAYGKRYETAENRLKRLLGSA